MSRPKLRLFDTRSCSKVIALLLICAFANNAHAQIWECSGQYTNQPEGKGRCQPAGGVTSCGSDGNRYFSPRRKAEAPSVAICNAAGTGLSPFVDMRQKRLAQFGGSSIHERLVAPAQVARASKDKRWEPAEKIEQMPASSIEDVFSCYSNPDKLKSCSPEGLGRFVERTFMSASKALQ